MNADQAGKLLGLMSLADNRKPPEDEQGRKAMIAFWLEMVGDLDFADAAQAIREHYRESTEWLKPAHIRERVRAIRAARLADAEIPAPPPELLDDPKAYAEHLRATTRELASAPQPVRAVEGP